MSSSSESPAGERKLLLMRGLPSCGKSTRARELVADGGVLVEFDAFFHTEVGDDPTRFDWSRDRMDDARRWTISRACDAMARGDSPVVLDDDNGLGPTTAACVRFALQQGYTVEFREPTSPWWAEIRSLLADKQANQPALEMWAHRLTRLSQRTHRVPLGSFRRRIRGWRPDLTVAEVLASAERSAPRAG